MAQTVGDYLLQRLREWRVEHVFGYAKLDHVPVVMEGAKTKVQEFVPGREQS